MEHRHTFYTWRTPKFSRLPRVGLIERSNSVTCSDDFDDKRLDYFRAADTRWWRYAGDYVNAIENNQELVNYYRFTKWWLAQTFFIEKANKFTFGTAAAPVSLLTRYAYAVSGLDRSAIANNKYVIRKRFKKAVSFRRMGPSLLDRVAPQQFTLFSSNSILRSRSLYTFYRFATPNLHPYLMLQDATKLLSVVWRQYFWRKRLRIRRAQDHVRYVRHRWRIIDFKRFLQVVTVRNWIKGSALDLAANSNSSRSSFVRTGRNSRDTSCRYVRHLWRICFRLKFERYVFNKVSQRVYAWFHSIWAVYFKKQQKWRSLEKGIVAAVFDRRKRRRIRIRVRMRIIILFIRVTGFLGLLSGGLHCFMHMVCFLFKKIRKHWMVLRFVKAAVRRCRRRLGTIDTFCLAVAGRLAGHMRKKKQVFTIGNILKLFLYSKRLSYVTTCSHTKWGVFGFNVWLHYSNGYARKARRLKHFNYKTLLYYQRQKGFLDTRKRELSYRATSCTLAEDEKMQRLLNSNFEQLDQVSLVNAGIRSSKSKI